MEKHHTMRSYKYSDRVYYSIDLQTLRVLRWDIDEFTVRHNTPIIPLTHELIKNSCARVSNRTLFANIKGKATFPSIESFCSNNNGHAVGIQKDLL